MYSRLSGDEVTFRRWYFQLFFVGCTVDNDYRIRLSTIYLQNQAFASSVHETTNAKTGFFNLKWFSGQRVVFQIVSRLAILTFDRPTFESKIKICSENCLLPCFGLYYYSGPKRIGTRSFEI